MVVGEYTVASGLAAPTEQDTLNRLDEFLTGALGWSRLGVVADTGTDNDRVWFSRGEIPGKYNPLYVGVQATGDDLIFRAYTLWSGSIANDVLIEPVQVQVPNANSGGQDEYVFVGNKDAFFVSIRLNSTGSNYVGGAGYWDTLYTADLDPYPVFVMGQTSNASTFETSNRVISYPYGHDGFLHTGAAISGTQAAYIARDFSFLTGLATPNPRDGRHLMMKQTFYRPRSFSAVTHEIRGEIPALFQFYGTNFASNDRVVASGVSTGDAIPGNEIGAGDFIVARGTSTNTYTLGPVTNYNPFPPIIPGLELWLKANAVERAGGDDSGGAVREWIDLSGNSRHCTQNTVVDQPASLVSGTASNNQSLVRFSNSQFLTGSVEVVNTYTVFVVARYTDGTSRSPLFYVRGAVGGDDTIIGMEFNAGENNSAEIRVRSDDSPLEEDIERYTGLTPDTFYILSAVVSGTNKTALYINGYSADSVTISDTKTSIAGSTTLDYGVGTSLDSSGSPTGESRHDGDIAEIIAYTRDLTPVEHQSVVCYLGGKYAITVSGTC